MKLNLMPENSPVRWAITTNEGQMAKRIRACFQRLNREHLRQTTENRSYNTERITENCSKIWRKRKVTSGVAKNEDHAKILANASFINNQTTRQYSRIIVSLMSQQAPLGQFLYKLGKCTCLKDEETTEHFIEHCQFYKRIRERINYHG